MVQQRISIESRDTIVNNVISEDFLGMGISDVNGEKESPRKRAVRRIYLLESQKTCEIGTQTEGAATPLYR